MTAPARLTAAQRQMVEDNLGLAHKVAWRWIRAGAARIDPATGDTDLIATAYMGLCRAAAVYDAGRGTRFSTIAVPYIMGELRRHQRDHMQAGGVRLSRGMAPEDKPAVQYLDAPISGDDSGTWAELVGQPEEVDVDAIALRTAIAALPLRLRTVITMRLGGDSQPTIAMRMGVTQASVSRWIMRAVRQLRMALADEGGTDMKFTELQRKILSAMQSLPAGAPVKRISQAVGEQLTVGDLKALTRAGLVEEVQRAEPPLIGSSLTPDGEQEAADIRQAHHPDIKTPEMAAPPPTATLCERVSREQLKAAVEEGRSLAWMCLRFDATKQGLQDLIAEYGIEQELAEEGRRRQTKGKEEKEEQNVATATAEKAETTADVTHVTAKHAPGRMKERQAELYARFAAGGGTSWAEKKKLAEEFGCAVTTIDYWHRQWNIGAERSKSAQPEAKDAGGPADPPAEGADQQIANAALEMMGVQPVAPEAVESIEQVDRPASQAEIEALRAHFAGADAGTAAGPKQVSTPLTGKAQAATSEEKASKLPAVGQICEAEVWRVDAAYVLVNLLEFYDGRRWLRGKVSVQEIRRDGGYVRECSDYLREGDVVNAKVLSVAKAAFGDKWNVTLSIRQAPPHDREPETLQGAQRKPEAPPISARGSDVARQEAQAASPQVAAASVPTQVGALETAYQAEYMHEREADRDRFVSVMTAAMLAEEKLSPQERRWQLREASKTPAQLTIGLAPMQIHLCHNCVKRDVCPIALADYYDYPVELPDEQKPEKLKHVKVTYGRRFVQECSSFHRE